MNGNKYPMSFRKLFPIFLFILAFELYQGSQLLAIDPPPPCNMEKMNIAAGGRDCGSPTKCPRQVDDVCHGISVVSVKIYSCVGGGVSSQRCEISQVICTRSYYCTENGLLCEPATYLPVLDPEGEPVVSYSQGAVMVSCIEP